MCPPRCGANGKRVPLPEPFAFPPVGRADYVIGSDASAEPGAGQLSNTYAANLCFGVKKAAPEGAASLTGRKCPAAMWHTGTISTLAQKG